LATRGRGIRRWPILIIGLGVLMSAQAVLADGNCPLLPAGSAQTDTDGDGVGDL